MIRLCEESGVCKFYVEMDAPRLFEGDHRGKFGWSISKTR